MTHQAIRISLILWQRLLKSLNAAVFTGMLCVGLYALVTNFAEARGAIGKVFVKLTQIQSFEGFNVKAAFAVDQIAESTPIYQTLPAEMRGMLPDDILSLRGNWVERILYVGDQGKLCDFASATQKMNEDYAADRHLAADGLITMKRLARGESAGARRHAPGESQKRRLAQRRAALLLRHRTHGARQKR